VDGFERIDVDGIGRIHFVDVGSDEATGAGVVGGSIAVFDAEILNFQAANGGGHPAVLIAMIVDAGELSDFPTDGHALEEIVFEDEITGVTALREMEVLVEGFGADLMTHDEGLDVFEGEILGGHGGEVFYPVGDGELVDSEIVGHERPPGNYNAGGKEVANAEKKRTAPEKPEPTFVLDGEARSSRDPSAAWLRAQRRAAGKTGPLPSGWQRSLPSVR
jgi:hypothetical protein